MSTFETELKKGNFIIPECVKCNETIWPPSDYCNNCLGLVKWKKSNKIGKILEFSKKDEKLFCLAEFEKNVKILGTLIENSVQPDVGKSVELDKCGIINGDYYFTMILRR